MRVDKADKRVICVEHRSHTPAWCLSYGPIWDGWITNSGKNFNILQDDELHQKDFTKEDWFVLSTSSFATLFSSSLDVGLNNVDK